MEECVVKDCPHYCSFRPDRSNSSDSHRLPGPGGTHRGSHEARPRRYNRPGCSGSHNRADQAGSGRHDRGANSPSRGDEACRCRYDRASRGN